MAQRKSRYFDLDSEIASVRQQIEHNKSELKNNHNDSADRQETRQILLELEAELSALISMQKRNYADARARLEQLHKRREFLEARLEYLGDKIDACDLNMDSDVHDARQCADYARDRARFSDEYKSVSSELSHVLNQIKSQHE